MPNTKIYLDTAHWDVASGKLIDGLPSLRELLCDMLAVDRSACHLVLIGVGAPVDQPPINVEVLLLPGRERTQASLRTVAGRLRERITNVTGLGVAVRIAMLDPRTYVALK
ncbi:hypothetical protein [Paraburkholderia sp. BCC1886]|uniref:hypothetical protein n=1 Tax=Paraburkholderia sp. BCC1886 TaxID=2562670 RepID=UPI0011838DF5|nr:hypothetical protein [Paraburkholderia sp. BCC1886]